MKTLNKMDNNLGLNSELQRRSFLKKGLLLGTVASLSGISLITSCKNEDEEDVTPSEDLMREHGVLNRILLIYDTCKNHLINNVSFDIALLGSSTQIIRTFIEEYHEKLEENFLFPRFEKAYVLTDLVQVLSIQHHAGRVVTDKIIQLSKMNINDNPDDRPNLIQLLSNFNEMYRPHEAREDTVLFPALKKIISRNEYYSLGEDFEKKEHELFGEDGFESIVEKVATIEKQLEIYDLSLFTPNIQ